MDYTPTELMTIVAARALGNDDVCFVGIGAPSTACNLARCTHAPAITLIYESGTIATRPATLPLSIGDPELSETALTTVSVPELFAYWLQGGRISVGFLGGAQIDRFGNLNSTVIGAYAHPLVRLPGAGGAPEIASACGRIFVIMAQSPRSFVPAVDFITSFGHGKGGDERQRLGFSTAGTSLVFTDLCVLRPHPATKELEVISIHPGVSAEQIAHATGWAARFADDAGPTPPPTDLELSALRDLLARTAQAHGGEGAQSSQ
jgi:glutaconate CoA-transferase subunit B